MKLRHPVVAFLLLMTLTLALGACAAGSWISGPPPVVGSGKIIKATPAVGPIKQVNLSGVGTMDITQGPADSLEIEADDNIMPLIETRMTADTLYAGLKSNTNVRDATIRYHLVVQDLNTVGISGATEVKMNAFKTAKLSIAISGAAKMYVARLEVPDITLGVSGAGIISARDTIADDIKVNLSGAGNVEFAGTARRQELTISGGSHYAAPSLITKDSNVAVSGAGYARIACDDTLFATASGAGNVTYSGTAKVTKSTSGAGVVEKQ